MIRGTKVIDQNQLRTAKQEVSRYVSDVCQKVRQHFLDVNVAAGSFSPVDEYFNELEKIAEEQVENLTRKKAGELEAEIARLKKEAELTEQQRKAEAEQLRGQMGTWNELGRRFTSPARNSRASTGTSAARCRRMDQGRRNPVGPPREPRAQARRSSEPAAVGSLRGGRSMTKDTCVFTLPPLRRKIMVLIPCPECGKSVSTLATSCPHCGCPSPADATAMPATTAEPSPLEQLLRRVETARKSLPSDDAQIRMCYSCGANPKTDGDLYFRCYTCHGPGCPSRGATFCHRCLEEIGAKWRPGSALFQDCPICKTGRLSFTSG